MRIQPTLIALSLLAAPVPGFAQTAGGDAASPNRAPRAESISPRAEPRPFQPSGSFPTNTVTNRPFVGPQGGQDGYRKVVGGLQRTLTQLQQLQLQLKQAHWNVSGSLFYPVHLLLQEHYEGVAKYADRVAERLLAIGASSDGRATTIVRTSTIPEIPGGFVDDAQVLVWFTNVYKQVGDEVRQSVRDTDEADPTSSNLLQEVESIVDKYQWQVRAHFQATPTDPNTGWNLNNNRPVELPDQSPSGQPAAASPGQDNRQGNSGQSGTSQGSGTQNSGAQGGSGNTQGGAQPAR